MEVNVIAFAIPVFFLLIGVEVVVARRQRADFLRFPAAIADLSCGIGNQVSSILFGGLLFAAYIWLFENFRFLELSASSASVWIATLLLVDVIYYFWHRASHRTNIIWAAHVVHHQSQDYNLAVALRQAWFTQFSQMLFYYSLALLGVPPLVFAVTVSVNTLYQFWIHTRTIGRMGFLESVFNTPSHHRVHHGINPAYIDKNYAGIFIVWDRLFGTFVDEDESGEEVVYGTVQPFESTNPIWANFVFWRDLARQATQAPRVAHKLATFLGPPEWTPDGLKRIPDVDAKTYVKYSPPSAPGVTPYVSAQFLLVTIALVFLLYFQPRFPSVAHLCGGALIVWTTTNFGGLFERKKWIVASEGARLLFAPFVVGGVLSLGPFSSTFALGATVATAILSALAFIFFAKVARSLKQDSSGLS